LGGFVMKVGTFKLNKPEIVEESKSEDERERRRI
jgi:hypothetical protein